MAESFALELPGGLRWVIEPPADPHGDGYVRTARVSIQASGLDARTVVTLSEGPWSPADFFAGLAADWRGWAGERRWRALEGEMEIEASHDGARVLVAVSVRRPDMTFAEDAWSARIVFALEPGEQLTGVARDLASVLSQ
jgi:Family of unknown function (DUF6228)